MGYQWGLQSLQCRNVTLLTDMLTYDNQVAVIFAASNSGGSGDESEDDLRTNVYANTPSITGSKLDNYKELKKELCDTNIFETFDSEKDLAQLLDKYKEDHYRINKLNEQKEALKRGTKVRGFVIRSISQSNQKKVNKKLCNLHRQFIF